MLEESEEYFSVEAPLCNCISTEVCVDMQFDKSITVLSKCDSGSCNIG